MNIAKNMEAIAIVAIVLACAANAAISGVSTHFEKNAARAAAAPIPTVTITAKRMTAIEKARYDE